MILTCSLCKNKAEYHGYCESCWLREGKQKIIQTFKTHTTYKDKWIKKLVRNWHKTKGGKRWQYVENVIKIMAKQL